MQHSKLDYALDLQMCKIEKNRQGFQKSYPTLGRAIGLLPEKVSLELCFKTV
jgi:hypothetical protein